MAVRTLQEFLASYAWNHARLRDLTRQRIVADHLPGPGEAKDELGVIGLIDETSVYVCEVPKNTQCWTTYPRYKSPTKNYVARTVENVTRHSPVFTGQKWKQVKLVRQTLGPQVWEVKSAQAIAGGA